jgi:uncharacterized protein YceH (UPF0502 family)
MNTITLEVPEDKAERYLEMLEGELEEMSNTLQTFYDNDIAHTEACSVLEDEMEELEVEMNGISQQIDEQTEEDEGLEHLFS